MGKIILALLFISVSMNAISSADIVERDKLTAKYYIDINGDGKKELFVHDFYGGSGGYGDLRINSSNGRCIFSKNVEGDPYLWHPEKHIPALNPHFFPDLDKDGIPELLIGFREQGEHDKIFHCEAEKAWWFDVYKWNGKTYELADNRFPEYYKEMLAWYNSYVKKYGECGAVKDFIKKAEKLSKLRGGPPS